jgi:multidrug efflux pump subunit AcrA (membrane-fusion protein)
MIRKFVLPLIALAGAAYASVTVAMGSRPAPVALPVADPAQAPFASYIAGSGIIEARGRNVEIGSPLPRVVLEVSVKVGDLVKAGAPLFRLDDRDLRAEQDVRRSSLALARARLDRLVAAPRSEEIPPVEARVLESETTWADLKTQLALWERVSDTRAVSEEDLSRKRFAARAAEARVAESRAQLALLKAGSWKPDVDVARVEVSAAEAQVKQIETELDRLVVRAPSDGTILQLNVRSGEFATAGSLPVPLVLFGNIERYHVRVDVDENDAWRFRKGAAAIAFVRGNRDLRTPLTFEWVEPYVVPKRSLTGDTTERVDTRVMQVVYSFGPEALPVYVGQQMDIFIEAPLKTSMPEPGPKGAPK